MTERERLTKHWDNNCVATKLNYDFLLSLPNIEVKNFNAIIQKLAHYEDLEEQGKIIVPPCKVGDTVYYAGIDTPVQFTVIGFSKGRMYGCSVADYEEFVEDNELNVDEWYVHLDSFCGLRQMSPLSSFGKRLFVGADAEKEAEKALAERGEENV